MIWLSHGLRLCTEWANMKCLLAVNGYGIISDIKFKLKRIWNFVWTHTNIDNDFKAQQQC